MIPHSVRISICVTRIIAPTSAIPPCVLSNLGSKDVDCRDDTAFSEQGTDKPIQVRTDTILLPLLIRFLVSAQYNRPAAAVWHSPVWELCEIPLDFPYIPLAALYPTSLGDSSSSIILKVSVDLPT